MFTNWRLVFIVFCVLVIHNLIVFAAWKWQCRPTQEKKPKQTNQTNNNNKTLQRTYLFNVFLSLFISWRTNQYNCVIVFLVMSSSNLSIQCYSNSILYTRVCSSWFDIKMLHNCLQHKSSLSHPLIIYHLPSFL